MKHDARNAPRNDARPDLGRPGAAPSAAPSAATLEEDIAYLAKRHRVSPAIVREIVRASGATERPAIEREILRGKARR